MSENDSHGHWERPGPGVTNEGPLGTSPRDTWVEGTKHFDGSRIIWDVGFTPFDTRPGLTDDSDSGYAFPKMLGAAERLAADLGNFAVAAVDLGEALQHMVNVGATAGKNPKFEAELTEAGRSAAQTAGVFEKLMASFSDPNARATRDIRTLSSTSNAQTAEQPK